MDEFLSLREIFGILRRQIRLILLALALIVIAALIYIFTAIPMYRATALVLFDPNQANILDPNEAQSVSAQAEMTRIESEVEILQSPATALALVEQENLVVDPEFGPRVSTREKLLRAVGFEVEEGASGEALLQQVLNRVLEARDVRREGLTYVISVSFTSASPSRAAELANAFARTHIQRQVEAKVASSLSSRDVLQGQATQVQQRLALSEEALNDFIDQNIERLEAETGSAELAELRAQLNQSEVNRLATQVVSDQANAALEERNWASLTQTLGDQAVASLNAQREDLERQLARASQGSETEVELRTALAEVEQDLEARSTEVLSGLRQTMAELEAQADTFRGSIREELLSGELSSTTVAELFSLQQEASIARDQYQTLLSRLRELEAQASVQVADSRIVSEALPPNGAAFPNKKLLLALALVAGLGLGVALAFANEFYVGGVTSPSQLGVITQAPVAASLPLQPQGQGANSVADLLVQAPLSIYSETIRKLRASIDEARFRRTDLPAGRAHLILICSSVPAEGKSTTALALARAYANAGKRVLLIDADLRKPSLHNYLGLKPEVGLLDYLTSELSDAERAKLVTTDPLSSCIVILGRGRSEVPTDQLVASQRMEALIEDVRAKVDIIVMDTPPLVPVVDARYLARFADTVVTVVRHATTTQADLRESVALLRQAIAPHTPVLMVLNLAQLTGRTYRSYKGYYGETVA